MGRWTTSLTIGSVLAASILPLQAASARSDLHDLIGMRGSSAEFQLSSRGYEFTKNSHGAALWWNKSSRTCASVRVANGRVSSVDPASADDCGKGGGGNGAAAAIAGVAAIGLIAALASHHKNSGDSHKNGAHDSEYERGYNDGLYSGHYDQSDSEAYHEGYMAGQAERGNRVASNSRYVRGAPKAAQRACTQRGDEYLNVPQGSSVPVGMSSLDGGLYQITVASGHYRARCIVDANGSVRTIDPY